MRNLALLIWDEDVLVGVLAVIARYRSDAERTERWRAAGTVPEPSAEKEVEVAFPDPIDPEISRIIQVVTVRGRPHAPSVGAFVREVLAYPWLNASN